MAETTDQRIADGPRPVCTLAEALCEEFRSIHGRNVPPTTDHTPGAQETAYRKAASDAQQAALCLSGGGIRSAAFNLGVIQALARRGLLTQFHYLSSVSGGGYIGGWLIALIKAQNGDVGRVQTLLRQPDAPPEVDNLRAYTNYLTPQPGLASPDTWTGITLWVRNVLVNWMLFMPALFALTLIPLLYRDVLLTIAAGLDWLVLLVALICLGCAIYCACIFMPSHAPLAKATSVRNAPSTARVARQVQIWVVWPVLAWCFLVPVAAAPSLRTILPFGAVPPFVIPFTSFLVMTGAYLLAALREPPEHERLFLRNSGWWILACAIASVILGIGQFLAINLDAGWLAVIAPLWVTLAHLAQSLFFVSLRRETFRGDLDREWLARLNAEKVIPALLWSIFAAVCLLLPPLLFDRWTAFEAGVLAVIGVLSGPVTAFIAKTAIASLGIGSSDKTSAFALPVNILIGIATAVFAALLFMVLARFGAIVTGGVAPTHADVDPAARVIVDAVVMLLGAGLSLALGRRINVNRFSMHAVYRNRLVRAFLGSARRVRTPDGFTGMDGADNPRMTDLCTTRLFPVINIALNLVAGHNNAWAERKAESFTVTPLACGAAYLHRIEDIACDKPARGAYARTALYGGSEPQNGPREAKHETPLGITLGTAITLSGASVSPNEGYHSSAATAFLMTLFNVRLGAWLPNPAVASTEDLRESKPSNALITIFREMLGQTDDTGRAIYLSDGGHFDDLGLYEMVRRRCRFVLMIDAGADPDAQFDDLGNAVRKVLIDQDIRIRFDPPVSIGSRTTPATPSLTYACGKIHYPEGGPDGEIVYVKPCYLPNVPIDVRAYGSASKTFPHEATLEQWFTESQFESYRRLGEFQIDSLTDQHDTTIAAFFDDSKERLDEAYPPKDTEIDTDFPVAE